MPGDGVDRVLVVTAHPDDVDFGAAGTVAAFTASGVAVAYCIVTDGDAGGEDRTMPRHEMAAIRREEQRAAAAAVGVHDVTFLGYPDGRLEPTIEVRRDVTRVIRRVRPQRVVTQSPERDWGRIFASHPDHLAAGEAATCAVYPDARNPFAHPELLEDGLEPHVVDELWLMAAPAAVLPEPGRAAPVATTVAVEIDLDRKLDALACHRSQVGEVAGLRDRLADWGSRVASDAGLPDGAFAESFRRVRTV
ncbi:MAG: PIG-L deacetylase family protein [Acidimicrobiales bacterium]